VVFFAINNAIGFALVLIVF